MSGDVGAKRAITLWTAVLVVVVTLVLVGAAGSFSAVCTVCHAEAGATLEDTAHAATSCYACHLVDGAWSFPEHKADELLVMYPHQIVGSGRPLLAETSRSACLKCHSEVLEKPTMAKGLRIKHAVCAEGSSCDGCHATVAHGTASGRLTSASMDECVACHSAQKVPVECETCHEGKTAVESLRPSAWQVTHGENWQKTHGLGDARSCAACHEGNFCAGCHKVTLPHPDSFGNTHGAAAIKYQEACDQCHDQVAFCDYCHGMPMPHPGGFMKTHSEIATSADDTRCARCHSMVDCATCHATHVHPGGSTPTPPPIGQNR